MTTKQLHNNRVRIGQIIADLRNEQNLSQMQLAEKADIRQETLSRLERGNFSPTLDLLAKLATALGKKIVFK